MPTCTLPHGGHLSYETAGSGETLLLIMGTGADRSFWAAQVPALSQRFRVVTYDSRGTGGSSDFARVEDCTPRALASDAAALLEHVGGGAAHVHGLSLGACVAMELGLSRPDLVKSLGLHGAWARSDAWFLRMVETMETALRSGGLPSFIRSATCWILSPDFHAAHPGDVLAMERAYVEREAARVDGVLAHCHADRVHDALDRLGGLRVPVLVTAGERDIQVPPRYGVEVAAAISNARFHLFQGPRASHVSCFELADEFNRVVLEFVAR